MGSGIGGHQRAYRGRSDDWLTPPEVLAALGPFDLDPCASASDPVRCAPRYYLPPLGLETAWLGRVWLNPPYGPQVGGWLRRLAEHGTGTALVFARTETDWFHANVWGRADAVLFLRGRLHFHRPGGGRARFNAGGPHVLAAYGESDAERLRGCGVVGKFVSLRGRAEG